MYVDQFIYLQRTRFWLDHDDKYLKRLKQSESVVVSFVI